jgi:hypothetical protein
VRPCERRGGATHFSEASASMGGDAGERPRCGQGVRGPAETVPRSGRTSPMLFDSGGRRLATHLTVSDEHRSVPIPASWPAAILSPPRRCSAWRWYSPHEGRAGREGAGREVGLLASAQAGGGCTEGVDEGGVGATKLPPDCAAGCVHEGCGAGVGIGGTTVGILGEDALWA